MAKINVGERVGKDGKLAIGCSASIFHESQEKMLLLRRVDNDRWAVPGGYMEPGENLSEAVKREVWEETVLLVDIKRLIGVYTSAHLLLEYPDGNKWQLVVLRLEAVPINGEVAIRDETSDIRYFSHSEADNLQISPLDRKRMVDGFFRREQPVICDDFVFGDKQTQL